jgi:hypothetical protein
MGSWGVHPMQDDAALDWVSEYVERPLVEVIEKTLKAYLNLAHEDDDDEDDEDKDEDDEDFEIEEAEAEACAAMLVDLTSAAVKWKYDVINIRITAKEKKLWDLAVKVVDEMIKYWKEIDHPEKIAVLKTLKAELKQAKKDNKDIDT